jgi:hypothetical protein
MHNSNFAPIVGCGSDGSEREQSFFSNWQCIHISAQCDHPTRAAPFQNPDHTSMRDISLHFIKTQLLQVITYKR